jgi:hypothetical protein
MYFKTAWQEYLYGGKGYASETAASCKHQAVSKYRVKA